VKKIRLDVYLSGRGLSVSREKARKEIISGWVRVNGETVRDPSRNIRESDDVKVERPGGIFVSRGGDKLKHALTYFNITLEGMTAADLGASTGGFTDCMLRAGAARVFSVDVGYGQLDYSLRTDPRVSVMERKNVRHLAGDDFDADVNFVTADLSFISITRVFENIRELFPRASGVILIKPQFEAERSEHKKGVVRKAEIHVSILARVLASLAEKGMVYRGLTFSPVKGPAGNIEFLLYFSMDDTGEPVKEFDDIVRPVVEEAHNKLG